MKSQAYKCTFLDRLNTWVVCKVIHRKIWKRFVNYWSREIRALGLGTRALFSIRRIVLELTPDLALGNNGLIPFQKKLVDPLHELDTSSQKSSLTAFLLRAVTLFRCNLYVFKFSFVGDW